ncbi:RHS repeat-associated core domain-containing protein [Chryseobacterium antibioticum]|uniref:RHS repeat-associated core domain-containing protein n=1 Tax=Chryseobacterium pyrolae TaxID=2987481 RepID=A0ABT2ICR8_9FLAO|nr:RHS repeat-associated core domain-containing protein [Chryseobacterium pyrolae]
MFLKFTYGRAAGTNSLRQPYKFNAKELDSETGLYYYGARYYNPRLSIWYGVDPLAVYNPVMETQFYGDGQHNGGVLYWGNLNPYIYTYQNPIRYIDPNGKQVDWQKAWNDTKVFLSDAGDVLHKTAENLAPITVHIKSKEEIAQDKAKYGDGFTSSFKEMWGDLKNFGNQVED